MKNKNKYWYFPLVFLIILSIIVVVIYLALNYRSTQKIYIAGTCERFQLPNNDTCALPKLFGIHARGFDIDINAIEKANLSSGKDALTISQHTLKIQMNPSRASDQGSLLAEFTGQMGDNSILTIPKNTLITGKTVDPSQNPAFTFIIPRNNDAQLHVATEALKFTELNRLIVTQPDVPARFGQYETLQLNLVAQKSKLIQVTLNSQRDSLEKIIDIKLAKGLTFTTARPLLAISCPANNIMELINVLNPTLKIDGFDAERQPKDMPLHVLLNSDSVRLLVTDIEINKQERKWYFRIILEGMTHSILVENHELVETEFDKIVYGPPSKKGIWGLVLLAITTILVAIFKRLLDNLLEYFFPEPKKEEAKPKEGKPEEAKPDDEKPTPIFNTKVIENSSFSEAVHTIVEVVDGIAIFEGFSEEELAIVLDSKVIMAESAEGALLDLKFLSEQLPSYTIKVITNKYFIKKI
ncbi:MAG: hypothetical protein QM802_22745 [Agriterribacter sp.]